MNHCRQSANLVGSSRKAYKEHEQYEGVDRSSTRVTKQKDAVVLHIILGKPVVSAHHNAFEVPRTWCEVSSQPQNAGEKMTMR